LSEFNVVASSFYKKKLEDFPTSLLSKAEDWLLVYHMSWGNWAIPVIPVIPVSYLYHTCIIPVSYVS